MKKVLTLCLIHKEDKILLGMKKTGFGKGWWNGFGGKVEKGEEIKKAAKRETFEEAGIEISDPIELGVIDFKFEGDPIILEVHIFKATNFTGNPVETEEMKPKWFSINKIPFSKMWVDDKFWMPLFLKNKKFKGKFCFDKDNLIINYELVEK